MIKLKGDLMIKKFLTEKKGITIVDAVLATTILCLFVGVIGNLYYLIASSNMKISLNAIATYYVVKIAEDIDKMPYEEVSNSLNDNLKNQYHYLDMITMSIDVDNYNEGNPAKQDVLKTVTIEAKYKVFNSEQSYKIKKLKIKEI